MQYIEEKPITEKEHAFNKFAGIRNDMKELDIQQQRQYGTIKGVENKLLKTQATTDDGIENLTIKMKHLDKVDKDVKALAAMKANQN